MDLKNQILAQKCLTMMFQGHGLGREKYLRGHIALWVMLVLGVILLFYSVSVGVMIGSDWFGNRASFPWHINNYIVLEARYAYSYFGLTALAIGGLATGLAAPAFFAFAKSKKHRLALACSFFVAIILTGLGFNTLDFMLGCFYWTNMKYPPPVQVAVLGSVDVWNYYFFFFVAPLWLGGFIMGLAASYYAFFCPKHFSADYYPKKDLFKKALNLPSYSQNAETAQKTVESKEYVCVVESPKFSRNRN